MRLKVAVSFLVLCVTSSLAIFPDEVDDVDFHHALLGFPSPQNTFFHRPSSSSSASLLYTLSDRLVLGAVHPKDGSLVWRQKLGDGRQSEGFLRASDGEDIVISAVDSEVSSWGASDGKLSWTRKFKGGPVRDLELLELQDGSSPDGAVDAIVLFGTKTGIVRRLDGPSGQVKWEYKDDRYSNLGITPFASHSNTFTVVILHSRFRHPPRKFSTSPCSRHY
jgi:ER membrane protein complex subunit 1